MNVSAPTVSQRAAVAALGEEEAAELAQHVKRYEDNRAVVVSGLQRMGEQTHPRAPPRQQGASLSLLGASLPGVQTHEYAPPQGKPRPPSAARLARRGASPPTALLRPAQALFTCTPTWDGSGWQTRSACAMRCCRTRGRGGAGCAREEGREGGWL